MSSPESRNLVALKGIALAATFSIATAQAATSLLFIPSLLRPLRDPSPPVVSSSSRKNSSTLNIPTTPGADGRLTPQPFGSFDFTSASSGAYRSVARQFSAILRISSAVAIPLELVAIGVFGIAALRSRGTSTALWKQWSVAAGLVGSVFPYNIVWLAPLLHKVKRIGGEEEKIEPYEDAPIDVEAERANTIEFVSKWGLLNWGTSVALYAAAVLGSITLLDE